MTETDALIAFLAARLDEDEAAARSLGWATRWRVGEQDDDGEVLLIREGDAGGPFKLPAPMTDYLTHIARHDPARTLREVEAKREILTAYIKIEADGLRGDGWIALRFAVETLAEPYSDHPDYDPSWKP